MEYMCLFQLWFPKNICPVVGLLGHIIILFHFLRNLHTVLHSAKLLQSCPVICNSVDHSPPGFSVHAILQVGILEWVAISFSKISSWSRDWIQVFCIASRCFTIWTTVVTVTICIPPTVQEGSHLCTLSVAFSVCRLFNDGHSDWCEMVPQCSFYLHFSTNKWCWASFHMFISHLYVSFG